MGSDELVSVSHEARVHVAETSRAFPCPACAGREQRGLFTVRGARYDRCATCGLAHLEPLPTPDALLAHFGPGYFEGATVAGGYDSYRRDESLHRRNARRRLARIARRRGGRPAGRLLDIGCAYGYALDEARRQGWSVTGVEPSVAAATEARNLGLDVQPDIRSARAAHPDGFDVVFLCQVLSHVADPAATLRDAAAALTDDGLLFIETWLRDAAVARLSGRYWHVISPPTVVWLETRASLRHILDGHGLTIVDWTRGHKAVGAGLVATLLSDRVSSPRLDALTQRFQRTTLSTLGVRYPFTDLTWITATRT